jgi:hypothetical protein
VAEDEEFTLHGVSLRAGGAFSRIGVVRRFILR